MIIYDLQLLVVAWTAYSVIDKLYRYIRKKWRDINQYNFIPWCIKPYYTQRQLRTEDRT